MDRREQSDAEAIALVRERLKGRSLASLASELGLTKEGVRRRLQSTFRRLLIAEERRHAAEERCRSLAARIGELELAVVRARAGKRPQEILVAELDLSSGEYIRLTAGGINSLSELAGLSRSQLLGTYKLGEGSLQGVEAELARHGLELSTESPADVPGTTSLSGEVRCGDGVRAETGGGTEPQER